MKIAIACDHSALDMKAEVMNLLANRGVECQDFGTYTAESCHYPLYGARAALAVADGDCDLGIVICGTGIGMSMVANKVKGVRCALCSDTYSAKMTRIHNNSNVLALGARVIGVELAKEIVNAWLDAEFEGGRHQVRIDMITALENGESIE
jgi:ribose 5-phosphate isomerase B